MLTEAQKEAIDRSAVLQVRESWGGLLASRVRGVIDDIRAKVVEEPWFGRQTTTSLNSPSELNHTADMVSVSDVYGWMGETAQSAWASLYGREPGQDLTKDLSRDDAAPMAQARDGPEPGD